MRNIALYDLLLPLRSIATDESTSDTALGCKSLTHWEIAGKGQHLGKTAQFSKIHPYHAVFLFYIRGIHVLIICEDLHIR